MATNLFKGVFSAAIGAASVAPICSLVDISVIKASRNGDIRKSMVDSFNNFSPDITAMLNFSIVCSSLLSSNFAKGSTRQVAIGTMMCMSLSMIKDSLLLDKDVPIRTKLLFILRDGIANSPCLLYPGGTFRKQAIAITTCQVPCTLINSYAMDYCLFSDKDGEYMCKSTYDRVLNHFYASYLVRVSRSMFSIGVSTGINHNMKKQLRFS